MPALPLITREALRTLILAPAPPAYAIIDVRDDDHIGGHIHTSTHVPSRGLDAHMPALVRALAGKEIVVFHCALSQQRGPKAARRYLGERGRLVVNGGMEGKKGMGGGVVGKEGRGTEGEDDWEEEDEEEEEEEEEKVPGGMQGQKVYVLDGGFVRWQEKYGRDERLTDSFAPDIWVDYY